MRNLNIVLLGALASALDLRYTPSGTPIAEFTIAGELTRARHDTGEAIQLPFYVQCSVVGKSAENLAERNYQPGDVLMVTGEPQYEAWKNAVGVQRSTVRVRALNVERVAGDFETVTDKGGFLRMVGGVNSATIIGHLTDDVKVTVTPSGDKVVNYRVGVNDSYTARGETVERTHWFDCTAWREQAEALEGMKKGEPVLVLDAALSRDTYPDKNGETVNRRYFEVTQNIALLNRPVKEGQARRAASAPKRQPQPAAPQEAPYVPDIEPAAAAPSLPTDAPW
ncbi:single-stranded DNA-binding protein [Deinococcus ruber]|uniref:Single-stranded DNA-binding protein n=1 Tax=Deinococcus ruber TaxID=1848197 RepID=A0A918F7X0_9DEIO|nr:single-stranded DNA-binding protein [Deinococcus ruber]GGR09678.1 single-stranded DNA-binding protein [Deinococcus ruber]